MPSSHNWDAVRELTERQRDKIYGSEAAYNRQVGPSPSWQTIRRLGKGELEKGVDHKLIPAIERVLELEPWTIRYLAEGDRARLLKLSNQPDVVELLDRLTSRPKPVKKASRLA